MPIKGFQIDAGIGDLSDVNVAGSPAITTGQLLRYNVSTGQFEHSDITIVELSDVDMTGSPAITTGQLLRYNSASEKFEHSDMAIEDLSNVSNIPPFSDGAVLGYNASTGKFKAVEIATFVGITSLPDVHLTPLGSPLAIGDNELFSYDSATSKWINQKAVQAGLISASSGLIDGGAISIGGGSPPITVTVAAGTGLIVDNYTDPLNPVYTNVSWSQFTDVTLTSLATSDKTYIAISAAGTLLQQTTDYNSSDRRDIIYVGQAGHPDRTNVTVVRNNPHAVFDISSRLGDLAIAIGAFNISGNIFSANGANLNLNKSSGESYRLGNNFHTSKKSPDITTDSAAASLSFNYNYISNTVGPVWVVGASRTTIDTTNYNPTNGLTAMPSNQWQVQVIRWFPGSANGIRIDYGQHTYGTSAAAVSSVPDIDHKTNPALSDSITRGYLIVKQGATVLNSTASAVFVEAGKFGASGTAGSAGVPVFSAAFESAELGIAINTNYSVAHGLGGFPKSMQAFLRCKTASVGYAINDEVEFMNVGAAGNSYHGLYSTATNIGWYTGSVGIRITNRTDGTAHTITPANWKIILRAFS